MKKIGYICGYLVVTLALVAVGEYAFMSLLTGAVNTSVAQSQISVR